METDEKQRKKMNKSHIKLFIWY